MKMPHFTYLFLKYDLPHSGKVWRDVLPFGEVYNRIITWDYFYLYLFIVFPIVMLAFIPLISQGQFLQCYKILLNANPSSPQYFLSCLFLV